jgi:ABC-type transport system involved in cytochrome c biogenesis ATPase subunit
MIRLTCQKTHRSIKDLPVVELSNFAVITGVNGAGKSHLLESIELGHIQIDGLSSKEAIKRYDWTNLTVQFDEVGDPLETRQRRDQALSAAEKGIKSARNSIVKWFSERGFKDQPELQNIDWLHDATEDAIVEILKTSPSAQHPSQFANYANSFIKQREQTMATLEKNLAQFGEYHQTLQERAEEKKRSIFQFESNDLRSCIPLSWTTRQLLQFRFAELFTAYGAILERNRINKYYAEHEGKKDLPWLDDESFSRRYGPPPWDLANAVLDKAGLRYRFNHPTASLEEGAKFTLRLTDPDDNGIELKIGDLSSGERILLSITLLLYQVTNRQLKALPQLLLLDEVDAPLHPSFTKLLLEILKETLVEQHGLKIIITTHSPSTVALAPPESLYELQRQPRVLRPVTRAHAVQVLTSGFITVMPSSRVVVTESSFDSLTHAELHESLVENGYMLATPPLSFVAASKQGDDGLNGGSAQVENWAPKLDALFQEIGFRGLLDRDKGRVAVGVIQVLNRYSIENYLLDPLTIAALLIKDGVIDLFTACPITDMNVHKIASLDVAVLQRLSDDITGCMERDHPILGSDHPGRYSVKYLVGVELSIPCWVRDFRGHDLVTLCKQTFNPICERVKRPITLPGRDPLGRVLEMQSRCLPVLIPEDLRDVYDALKI